LRANLGSGSGCSSFQSPGKEVISQFAPSPQLFFVIVYVFSFAAPLPGLLNELRLLPEPRFAHRENYYRQGLNNRKFDTKLTLKKNELVPSGVAMPELSNGIKKHN
jgi:hypothetical protein